MTRLSRMAARVLQVDLTHPLPTIATGERYAALWILVSSAVSRSAGCAPPRRGSASMITPDMLHALIADTIVAAGDRRVPQPRCAVRADTNSGKLPSMSVVVCTREHPDVLERQLHSLVRLDYPNFEVIVVDNAPQTERHAQGLRQVPARPLRPRAAARASTTPATPAGRSRRNEIVAYTDDDACVDPQLAARRSRHNYLDPQGQVRHRHDVPVWSWRPPAQEYFEKYGGMQRGFHRKRLPPGTWNTFLPAGLRPVRRGREHVDPPRDAGDRWAGSTTRWTSARSPAAAATSTSWPACITRRRAASSTTRAPSLAPAPQDDAPAPPADVRLRLGLRRVRGKYAHDLELGNHSMAMLKRWGKRWGFKRLKENLLLAAKGKHHFPINLILMEILGGVMGVAAYRRSVRKVKNDGIRFKKLGMLPRNRRASSRRAAGAPRRSGSRGGRRHEDPARTARPAQAVADVHDARRLPRRERARAPGRDADRRGDGAARRRARRLAPPAASPHREEARASRC